MSWLPAGVLGTLTANVLLVWVYLLLLHAEEPDERPSYLRWWLGAWIASVVRHSATLALTAGAPIPTGPTAMIEMFAALANGALILAGALAFVGRRMPPLAWVPFALAGVAGVAASLIDAPAFWRRLPVFVVIGLSMMVAGGLLWRRGGAGLFGRLTGGVFVLWGLHRLDYPFLRPVDWFAPYGFAFAAAFEQIAAVSTVLLHLDRARQRIRASEARYRGLVEEAPIGIFRVGLQTQVVDANPAFLAQLGVASFDELGEDLAAIVPAAEDRLALAEAFRAGGSAARQIVVRRPDGRERRLVVQGRELLDPSGVTVGYEGVSRDVTEAQRLEDRLRASERLEAIGRLAGGVAHDFNNVLTVIQAGTRAAIDHPSPTKQRKLLGEVLHATERGAELTRQLLTLSRARGTSERLELGREVRASLPFLTRLAGESVEILVDAPAPAWIVAERAHVHQILLNLVANARDAMPGGGVVRVVVRLVDGNGDDEGTRACLEVHDEGMGMDAETRDKAFEAFFTTKAAGEGTGLGLPTVAAAAAHGEGTVHVQSARGKGTTMQVCWRAVDPPAEADPPAPMPETWAEPTPTRAAVPAARHILVAEDEAAVRRALVRVLEAAGHRVHVAEDGEDALARYAELERLDLLVSDVRMPRMDGPSLAIALRERQPGLAVLFVTGYAEVGPVELQELVPGARVLAKPFLPHELTSAVGRVLSGDPDE